MEFAEEMADMKDFLVKSYRRRMEARGVEVRRLHIIYFLSRMGRIEQPHLFRVHHVGSNGVRLRDVKRWLKELRGKDLPDSFSWSYKRRYKSGFVWQDLLDDDLVTPISDNEYVLKGSEISSSSPPGNPFTGPSAAETPAAVRKQEATGGTPIQNPPENGESTQKSAEFDEKSTETDATSAEKASDSSSSSSSFSSSDSKEKTGEKEKFGGSATFAKSKSHSGGATHVFRSLLSCRAVDTDDSVLKLVNRHKTTPNSSKNNHGCDANGGGKVENTRGLCRSDVLGGSERFCGRVWDQNYPQYQSRRKSFSVEGSAKTATESINPKSVSAIYRPTTEPTCSQCGKAFKPEKLHAHMKSCRALKAKAKAATSRKIPSYAGKTTTAPEQPAACLYLTQ